MSDNKEEEDIAPKGNEWEVVALTESAYAAAPGPEQGLLDNSHASLIGEDDAETARAMLMSGHFGFSPSTHKNLPLEPEYKDKCVGKAHDHHAPQVAVEQVGKLDLQHEENLHIEGLVSDEFRGVSQFDEKGNTMSFYSSDFGDVASSNVTEKEQSMYNTGKFGSDDDEATVGRSYMANEVSGIAEPFESLDHAIDSGTSDVGKHLEEDKFDELPDLPCEAWWRRNAASLYDNAKKVNPFWSIVVAAAVVGLVIIGHRWQRGKPQVFQLKSELVIDDKGSSWILVPMARLKDVTFDGQHRSYI